MTAPLFAIAMPGPLELMLVLFMVLIVFGAGRLPQVFESFGKGIKSFKDAQREDPVDVTPRREELAEGVHADELREAKERQRHKV